MLGVRCSTCPQCLDGGVSRIQPFDLYIDVNTNQMHYAWQAGVHQFFSTRLAAALRRINFSGQRRINTKKTYQKNDGA